MKKKRALVIGFPFKFQIDIIDRCNIEPIYWLASQTKDVDEIKKRAIWHNAEKVDRTEDYPKEVTRNLIPELEQQFFDQNPKFCLDNIRAYFDRKDRFGASLTFDEARRNLYRDTSFWHYILHSNDIEIVIIESFPHLPSHLIPFRLAKILNIQALFLYQIVEEVKEPFRFIICSDIDNAFPKHVETNSDYLLSENHFLKDSNHNGKSLSIEAFTPSYEISIMLKRFIIMSIYNPKQIFKSISNSIAHQLNKLLISRLVSPVPSCGKMIYFPLSAQPEYNSGPMANNFDDLILAIRKLSKAIPADWKILVKEHPFQFELVPRNRNFFMEISKIPNVLWVPTSENPKHLMEKSTMVATLGGTSGWEALLQGLPVIVFGQIWYLECEGAYHWYNLETDKDFFYNFENPTSVQVAHCLKWIREISYKGIFIHQLREEGLQDLKITESENAKRISEAINFSIH